MVGIVTWGHDSIMTHHVTWCVIKFDWGWWLDLATPVMTHHVTWCVICHAWTVTWRLCIWVVWGRMREMRDCSIFACVLWQGLKWTSLQTIIKPDSTFARVPIPTQVNKVDTFISTGYSHIILLNFSFQDYPEYILLTILLWITDYAFLSFWLQVIQPLS